MFFLFFMDMYSQDTKNGHIYLPVEYNVTYQYSIPIYKDNTKDIIAVVECEITNFHSILNKPSEKSENEPLINEDVKEQE